MILRMLLENKNIKHNEACFICGVYCSIVLLQSTATKKQDYISPGASAPNKNLIEVILCSVLYVVLG